MIGLAVLSYSMDEIMKMYGGVFLYSNDPLGTYGEMKRHRTLGITRSLCMGREKNEL